MSAASAPHSGDAGLTVRHWQRDLPSSIVVFLVALPLCMGVAIASGAPVATGLITGIIGGLIVGFLAGSPLQVSGPAAGLTVVVYQLIQTLGIEKLGVCVLAAGALQLVAGYFRLGQWFRAVSPAVIQGMLAGIGVLILASQFHVMLDDKPHHSGIANLLTIPQAVAKTLPLSPLGSTEQRSEETRELKQLGQLHLEQVKLVEAVHHHLSSVSSEEIAVARNLSPQDTIGQVTSADERASGKGLQEFAAQQKQIQAELESFQHQKSPEKYAAARAALQAAAVDLQQGDIFSARKTQDEAEAALNEFLRSRKNHGWAAMLGLLTIGAILAWKLIARSHLKTIPAALVAVVATTLVASLLTLPVLYVEVPDTLTDAIYFPRLGELQSLLDYVTWIFIVQLAVIASAETLLCAAAVDRLHTGPRTDYDRELRGQGVGNILCGLVCALPMTGVIVRSGTNVQAGARTRLSSILHGLWLLVFVCLFSALLRNIPTAALAGILVYSGFKLIDFGSIKHLARRGYSEVAIYVVTVVTIVCTDLLIGVLVGVALSIVKLLYVFSHLEVELEATPERKRTLHLRGSATFLKLPILAAVLERIPPDAELHVNVEHLDYIDAACLDLLDNWEAQNAPQGGQLVIDLSSLRARFWRRRAVAVASANGNGNGDGAHQEAQGNGQALARQRQIQQPI